MDVINATSGVDTAYPIQPPPSRIAVAPVPEEPLSKCANPFALINNVIVPTIIRPVAAFSSGTLNNLIAK